jgi:NADH-quinone oxidoreductase subunit G
VDSSASDVYYSKLKGSGGKCRCCLVEVAKGSEADPRPMPKLMASCVTGCMDGMEVNSKSSPCTRSQKISNRVLLINHPLDCRFVIRQENVIYKI